MKTNLIKGLAVITLFEGIYVLYTIISIIFKYYEATPIFIIPMLADLITGLGLILTGVMLFINWKTAIIFYGISVISQIVLFFILPQMMLGEGTRQTHLIMIVLNAIVFIFVSVIILKNKKFN